MSNIITTIKFGYKKAYIAGKLVNAAKGQKKEVVCPATEKSVAKIAWCGKDDANLALDAAHKGFGYWSGLSLAERTQWMHKLREAVIENESDLRNAVMYEIGKPYEATLEDFESLINSLEWFPAAMKNRFDEIIPDYENTHSHKLISRPSGVAVAYLAWNFPLLNLAFKIGPALAAGCSLIIKPSTNSPLSAYILGEIMHKINFPAGVVNILSGPNSDVADTLTKSDIPSVITLIGSTATGKKIISDSTSSIKHFSMELGGNAPYIVFEDADIAKAVDLGIKLKFGNSGQVCVSPNRFLIHESVYDQFVGEFVTRATNLKIGFGESGLDMGPIVSKQGRDRMVALVKNAVSQGAKIECGGKISKTHNKGFWFEPTVLTNVKEDMDVFKKEIFGPIAAIKSFKNDDEALKIANNTTSGLASYIFTNNNSRVEKFTEELQFGEIQVNGVKYAIYLPHGGIKNSGIGFDCSHLSLDDYLIKKRISIAKNV